MSGSKSNQSVTIKSIRIPGALNEEMAEAAQNSGQSENAWITDAIRYWLKASGGIREERRRLLQNPGGDIVAAEEGGEYGGKKPPKKGGSKP